MSEKKDVVEEAIKLLPKEWEVEIDVEEYFPDWEEKTVIPIFNFDTLEEGEYEYIQEMVKDRLMEEGYSEEEAEKAVKSDKFLDSLYDVPIEKYVVLPNIGRVKIKWERTDPWRGYYTLELPTPKEAKDQEPVKIDLVYIARGEDNDRFVNLSKDLLRKAGFEAVAVALPSSNVFASNVSLIVKPVKHTWNDRTKDFIEEFDKVYTDVYTEGFSIFTGETYPLDFNEFEERIKSIAKKKLGEVI